MADPIWDQSGALAALVPALGELEGRQVSPRTYPSHIFPKSDLVGNDQRLGLDFLMCKPIHVLTAGRRSFRRSLESTNHPVILELRPAVRHSCRLPLIIDKRSEPRCLDHLNHVSSHAVVAAQSLALQEQSFRVTPVETSLWRSCWGISAHFLSCRGERDAQSPEDACLPSRGKKQALQS